MFLGNNHNASLYISLCIDHNVILNTENNVIKKQIVAAAQIVQVNIT